MALLLISTGAVPLLGQEGAPRLECRHVDVEARRSFVCTAGDTGPTVVFEAGMRDDHRAWELAAPEVARFARVITYDRAGNGASDPRDPPRTPFAIATELRSLLVALDASPPYLLVGHSAGGWHVRAFAELFPNEVSGLLLLDAPHEAFEERRLAIMDTAERQERTANLERSRSFLPAAIREEYAGIDDTRDRFGALPAVPLLVVTARQHDWGPTTRGDQFEAAWHELQADLATLAPGGRLLVADDTGHQIPRDRPDLVIESIAELIGRTR